MGVLRETERERASERERARKRERERVCVCARLFLNVHACISGTKDLLLVMSPRYTSLFLNIHAWDRERTCMHTYVLEFVGEFVGEQQDI